MSCQKVSSSFRDPSGQLFRRDGQLYRQVNKSYAAHYDKLIESGLYDKLTEAGLLIPHTESDIELAMDARAYKVIQPELIRFISYPYEWSFSQLKDAALLTLDIQLQALECGMTLKDCSSYNVQFRGSKPVFIDTLSFESYSQGEPWVAYGQFCRHFLAPLALMARRDVRLNQLLRIHVDGMPLDLADKLLGWRTRLSLGLYLHIHLHARTQRRYEDKPIDGPKPKVSKLAMLGLLDSLKSIVRKLKWKPAGTEWGDYYSFTNYTDETFRRKKAIVTSMLERTGPHEVWDMGANTGLFSRLASDRGIPTVAFDVDPAAIEKNYLETRGEPESCLLPLVMDLTNPSSHAGWANEERMSLISRGPTDTVMALALVHHLAISNNVPLERIARFFARICSNLIIEFVPKEDSQVKRLLASREDVFPSYHSDGFEQAFGEYFSITDRQDIEGTSRTVYLMKKHTR